MSLTGYIQQQCLKATAGVTLVLLLFALTNRFVRLMGKVTNGELSMGLLAKIIALSIPELAALLLSLGLFLGVILALGRLYAEQELVAMQALGLPFKTLTVMMLKLGGATMILIGIMSLWLVPHLHWMKEKLLTEEETTILMQSLMSGRFQVIESGNLVFYVAKMNPEKTQLWQVFIADQPDNQTDTRTILTAESGRLIADESTGQRYLELYNGTRYHGVPGRANYSEVHFETYGRLIEHSPDEVPMFNRVTPTTQLLASASPNHQAELQWRITLPLLAPILSLMALGLSKVPPRGGRYARLLPAVLLYIVYMNVLTLSKRAVESGQLSAWIGVWWVHVLAVMLAAVLVAWHSGAIQQRWSWARR